MITLDSNHKQDIEEIISQVQCPKDFVCYKSGFEILGNAKDIGLPSHLKCLEKEPQSCHFSLPFAHEYWCKCPVRIYIAKNLGF